VLHTTVPLSLEATLQPRATPAAPKETVSAPVSKTESATRIRVTPVKGPDSGDTCSGCVCVWIVCVGWGWGWGRGVEGREWHSYPATKSKTDKWLWHVTHRTERTTGRPYNVMLYCGTGIQSRPLKVTSNEEAPMAIPPERYTTSVVVDCTVTLLWSTPPTRARAARMGSTNPAPMTVIVVPPYTGARAGAADASVYLHRESNTAQHSRRRDADRS
jgi:hypothetical protein